MRSAAPGLPAHREGRRGPRWLSKAQVWLDQFGDGLPRRAEEELGLYLDNWIEAHVLRREAEAPLLPNSSAFDR
jgi:hypothetical protein